MTCDNAHAIIMESPSRFLLPRINRLADCLTWHGTTETSDGACLLTLSCKIISLVFTIQRGAGLSKVSRSARGTVPGISIRVDIPNYCTPPIIPSHLYNAERVRTIHAVVRVTDLFH